MIKDASPFPALSLQASRSSLRKFGLLGPVAAALAYPHLLRLFHSFDPLSGAASVSELVVGCAALLGAVLVPLYGLRIAALLGKAQKATAFELGARRLAFLSMTAPPLFVLSGVALGLLGSPVRDVTLWNICWTGALLLGAAGSYHPAADRDVAKPSLRVFHGVTAAIVSLFVLFHLANHLTGLIGPSVHARVMEMGRVVYRSGAVEPVLIGLLLLQIASGGRLAWRWSRTPGDLHRTIQIGTGVYIGAFIITHLNSALVSARTVRGIPTNWAWASGAPEGLLLDAWNIRLVPHYAFGVLFVLMHLCEGLRVVLIARGAKVQAVDRAWAVGIAANGLTSAAIMAALLGFRI